MLFAYCDSISKRIYKNILRFQIILESKVPQKLGGYVTPRINTNLLAHMVASAFVELTYTSLANLTYLDTILQIH